MTAPAFVTHPASARSLEFLDSLMEARDDADVDGAVIDTLMDRMDGKPLSQAECSAAISALKDCPRKAQARSVVPAAGGPAVVSSTPVQEPGMYRDGDTIYRVQRSRQSGGLYAKRLVASAPRLSVDGETEVDWDFEYAKGAVLNLRAEQRMTEEQAVAFGVQYGFCCICATRLEAAKSVKAGIGPVCRKRI